MDKRGVQLFSLAIKINSHPSCHDLQYRWNRFKEIKHAIDSSEGGMDNFSQGMSDPMNDKHLATIYEHLLIINCEPRL